MDIFDVELSKHAIKDLEKIPARIKLKLYGWIEHIKLDGLYTVMKTRGYHDEPLRGHRQGERSIRLSKAYRAIYIIDKTKTIHFITIQEVNKHDYSQNR